MSRQPGEAGDLSATPLNCISKANLLSMNRKISTELNPLGLSSTNQIVKNSCVTMGHTCTTVKILNLLEDMDEEVFEIIDYTSASGWERLITSIEQTLLQWDIDGESFGLFEESRFKKQQHSETNFSRKETLNFNEQSFSLYYYYCPPSASKYSECFLPSEGSYHCPPNTTSKIPPLHIRNTHPFHPLHRWTGRSHILVLKPAELNATSNFSLGSATLKDVNQETFDMSLGKFLLSACAVAFHVARCSIPVYLPVGQAGRSMYIGFQFEPGLDTHSLQIQQTDEDLGCFEYRTRSVSLSSVPTAYSSLQSLIKLFEHRTSSTYLQSNALGNTFWNEIVLRLPCYPHFTYRYTLT